MYCDVNACIHNNKIRCVAFNYHTQNKFSKIRGRANAPLLAPPPPHPNGDPDKMASADDKYVMNPLWLPRHFRYESGDVGFGLGST